MKNLIYWILILMTSSNLCAQDEAYENRKITDAFDQHSDMLSLSYATDGENRYRIEAQQGEFYFDNFIAGPQLILARSKSKSAGAGGGYYAKNYFLNGIIRPFVQVEANILFMTGSNSDFLTNTDIYGEYALQGGLAIPVDLHSGKLNIELHYQYSEPMGSPEIKFHGNTVGLRLAYIY